MKIAAEIETARVSVLLDLRHPQAYLALHPTLAFAESLALDVNWLPLGVPSLKPPRAAQEGDDRGTRHRRYRAQALAREIETYADAQGLVLRDFYRSGEAEAANLAWLWLRDRQPDQLSAFLVELFRAYWSLALDPSSGEQVAAVLARVNVNAAGFAAWCRAEGQGVAAALAAELQERGLFQVPAYVVGEEVFYGRQHLPMIRWLLAGRTGAIPS
jgi:2-hydroxychromene-2-carboxylate isomerase